MSVNEVPRTFKWGEGPEIALRLATRAKGPRGTPIDLGPMSTFMGFSTLLTVPTPLHRASPVVETLRILIAEPTGCHD